jgi:O-antigen/teichoic acid export membrane protein
VARGTVGGVPETDKERYERNFADLLQELRVAQTGVQILFAFLLTLPFSAGFDKVNEFQRDVYVVALLAAAGAAATLIAPVAYHRVLFQRGRKAELVRSAHRMASGGLVFMLVAMVSAVLLITDFILDRWVACLLSGVTGVWFVLLWLVLPLLRRDDRDENPTAQ